jgi:methylmalonyl-CoA/ethylmalonyl-CoA epimerase
MSTELTGRVHQIAQKADDLDRAVRFYRDIVGLPLLATFDPPGLAFFDLGNVRLMLETGASSAVLYLEVTDINTARSTLVQRGVHFVDEPHLIFHDTEGTFGLAGTEEWMTFFHDSEQNVVGLVERRVTLPDDAADGG